MASDRGKKSYVDDSARTSSVAGPVKVGLIATASALAGGLAVAWWYRDTLKKLRNPVVLENLPKSGSFENEFPVANQDEFDASEPGTLPRLVQD
jgi:hypothetical protein